jgi:hypothetical protein
MKIVFNIFLIFIFLCPFQNIKGQEGFSNEYIHKDSCILPFGPKSLEYLVKTNQQIIGFAIPQNQDLTDEQELKNRKLIYETWMYYLNFIRRAYVENPEYSIEIKTVQYFDLDSYYFYKQELDFDSFIGNKVGRRKEYNYAAKLPNIQGFDVYYSIVRSNLLTDPCKYFEKTEENCCFIHGYYCQAKGYLNFYDREKQHSIIIPVYNLNPGKEAKQGEFSYRFFYVSEDSTIHIFEGCSFEHDYTYIYDSRVSLFKTHEIKITKDKEFIINKIIEND